MNQPQNPKDAVACGAKTPFLGKTTFFGDGIC
jgi:hypothetical protein